jgi:hypothetical protein
MGISMVLCSPTQFSSPNQTLRSQWSFENSLVVLSENQSRTDAYSCYRSNIIYNISTKQPASLLTFSVAPDTWRRTGHLASRWTFSVAPDTQRRAGQPASLLTARVVSDTLRRFWFSASFLVLPLNSNQTCWTAAFTTSPSEQSRQL